MKTPYKLSENTFDHNEIKAVKNILDNILLPYQFDESEMRHKGVNTIKITHDVVDNNADPVLLFTKADEKKQQKK